MPLVKYETLQKRVKEYESTLLTTKEEYTGTASIKWSCSCGIEDETSYKTFVRWTGKCLKCRKKNYKQPVRKGRESKYTYEFISEIYEKAGCSLLTSREEYIGPKKPVMWRCSCGRDQKSSFDSFNNTKRCRKCGIQEFKGVSYESFGKLLQEHGWSMLGSKDKYKNTKTLMKVKSKDGIETYTTYNRFHQGHRSKKEADDSFRNSQEKVEREFKKHGFVLLDEYTNKKTPMLYICQCDREAYMAYENLLKNKVGCRKCAIEKWHKNSSKLKKYEMPSGKIVEVQGYEPFCLDELLNNRGIPEDDIVVEFDKVPVIEYLWKGGTRYYYPDVFIPSQNKIIEVKSTYTYSLAPEKNEVKWETVAEQGYKMECLFYDPKGKLLESRVYTPDYCIIFHEIWEEDYPKSKKYPCFCSFDSTQCDMISSGPLDKCCWCSDKRTEKEMKDPKLYIDNVGYLKPLKYGVKYPRDIYYCPKCKETKKTSRELYDRLIEKTKHISFDSD